MSQTDLNLASYHFVLDLSPNRDFSLLVKSTPVDFVFLLESYCCIWDILHVFYLFCFAVSPVKMQVLSLIGIDFDVPVWLLTILGLFVAYYV